MISEDARSASAMLFGAPSRSISSEGAQHPLMVDPTTQAHQPQLPRGIGTLSELLNTLEGMGGSQAVQILENLLSRSSPSRQDAIRINLAHEENGLIGLSIGNRSITLPAINPASPYPGEPSSDYTPRPTAHRWQEELAVVPGPKADSTARLVIHIINRLLPEARSVAEEEAARLQRDEELALSSKMEPMSEVIEGTRSSNATLGAATSEDIEMGKSSFATALTGSG
jgi:E3 ubiquitin-protein ligase HUWE1